MRKAVDHARDQMVNQAEVLRAAAKPVWMPTDGGAQGEAAKKASGSSDHWRVS